MGLIAHGSCTGGTIRHKALIENSSNIDLRFKITVIKDEIVLLQCYSVGRL